MRFQYLAGQRRGSDARHGVAQYTPISRSGRTVPEDFSHGFDADHRIPVKSRATSWHCIGGTSLRNQPGPGRILACGPLRLSAYDRGELIGSDYFLAQVDISSAAKLNPVIADAVYAGDFMRSEGMGRRARTPNLNDIQGYSS
jgi:hypothetical protein